MQLFTGLTGPFPRPESLVQSTRDLDRGRTTPEAVEELYAQTEREIGRLEGRLGLEPRTGGYLRWPDLFRPFAESWPGFTVGPLTRWFETNTFFRQPILHAPPERRAALGAPWFPGAANGGAPSTKAILPGPYTFAGLLDNRSGETMESVTQRLGRLLADEVQDLRARGYTAFQFQEPLLVTQPPEGPLAASVAAAYRPIEAAAAGHPVAVWTFFGDGGPALPTLLELPVSLLGFDLAETDLLALPAFPPRRGIGLGIIDPRTSLIEEASEVIRLARAIEQRHRPTTLWLGPGAPLDLLPWEPATRKLHVLPAVRQGLSPAHGGR